MSRTRWPSSASAAPRLTAVVVLPTPPFCMATAIVRAKSAPSLTEAGRNRPFRTAPAGLSLELAAVFVVPLIAAVVGGAFAVVVGRQYMSRRRPQLCPIQGRLHRAATERGGGHRDHVWRLPRD